MKPFRQLQYDYYRLGLDEMAQNAERGRTNVTKALETHLKKAHDDKHLSLTDISDQFGFSSQSHFSRYVQKNLGISPSDFRQ